MKTKEKILLKALELFNSQGVKEVTLRQIATELGISQGNLNYHFKLKGDIVSALYFRLVEEMNAEMQNIVAVQPLLKMLFASSLVSMRILYKYQFLMKDLYAVLSADDRLKTHYLELQKERENQFIAMFQNMQKEGILREEELEGEYARLHERMNILGDNWINASLFFKGKNRHVIHHYHRLLFEVIYPYLTPKGKELYTSLQ